jgi:DNA-binding response OmpR family regulator
MARILIIDDDPDTRAMLEDMLKLAHHETVTAADGKQGIKQHLAKPADLVITDIFMPDQDGFETIQALRNQFPTVAIIAMSGKAVAPAMLSIAQKLGAAEVLQKPFISIELLNAVDKVLGRKSPQSQ